MIFTDYWNCFRRTNSLRIGLLVLCLFAGLTTGRANDVYIDTIAPPRKVKSFKPSPQRAALYGLIPGGGQIYNRSYWKVPIVYGLIGGLAYLTRINTLEYRRFRDAYSASLKGEPHEFSNLGVSTFVLRNIRDESRKSMEEAYVFLTLAYFAQMAEAYVDAHLQDFDISDDLSLRINPTIMPTPFGIIPAGSISFNLKARPKSATYLFP
jgi:hypothetical protein